MQTWSSLFTYRYQFYEDNIQKKWKYFIFFPFQGSIDDLRTNLFTFFYTRAGGWLQIYYGPQGYNVACIGAMIDKLPTIPLDGSLIAHALYSEVIRHCGVYVLSTMLPFFKEHQKQTKYYIFFPGINLWFMYQFYLPYFTKWCADGFRLKWIF